MNEYVVLALLFGVGLGIWFDRLLLAERWRRGRELESKYRRLGREVETK